MIRLNIVRPAIDEVVFKKKAEKTIDSFEPFLSHGDRIIDLGAGVCMITKLLRERGYDVAPVDVTDKSLYPSITPIIYDGKRLPYHDNQFDVCLLIAVLHHTSNPEKVIAEASRVSKKLIVLENVYINRVQKLLTYWADSLINLEFFGHPHTNRTDRGWKSTFQRMKLTLTASRYETFWGFLHDAIYLVTKNRKRPT